MTMTYKGYTGNVQPDADLNVLFGRVIGLRDVITFEGATVAEVTQAFHDSVDDYLEFCAKRGETPEKPFSGKFVLRIDPELHLSLASTAEKKGLSLNDLIVRMLKRSLDTERVAHPGTATVQTAKVTKPKHRVGLAGEVVSKGQRAVLDTVDHKKVAAVKAIPRDEGSKVGSAHGLIGRKATKGRKSVK
jgi:predicted HicB family RNase H-like nuclease